MFGPEIKRPLRNYFSSSSKKRPIRINGVELGETSISKTLATETLQHSLFSLSLHSQIDLSNTQKWDRRGSKTTQSSSRVNRERKTCKHSRRKTWKKLPRGLKKQRLQRRVPRIRRLFRNPNTVMMKYCPFSDWLLSYTACIVFLFSPLILSFHWLWVTVLFLLMWSIAFSMEGKNFVEYLVWRRR